MADFFSLDRQHAWALIYNKNDKEFLFRTTDGGANWTGSAVPFSLWRVFFADTNEGWAIASEGDGQSVPTFCLHTSDSGRTWNRLGAVADHDERPRDIAFDSKEHGWVVGEGYAGTAFVLETKDGGKHWTKVPWQAEEASGLYGIRVYHGTVFAWSGGAGGSGIFELRSGALPKQISELETMNFAFVSDDSIVSASPSAVYQRPGSESEWEQVLETSHGTFWDMTFPDPLHGCVVGSEVYCTDDGGRTWGSRPLPYTGATEKGGSDYVYHLYLVDPMRGWAVSAGAIFQTDDGAHTWDKIDFFDTEGTPLGRVRYL